MQPADPRFAANGGQPRWLSNWYRRPDASARIECRCVMACARYALRPVAGYAVDSLPPSRAPDEETLRSRECRDDWRRDAADSTSERHPVLREFRRCRESADPAVSIDSMDANPSLLPQKMRLHPDRLGISAKLC